MAYDDSEALQPNSTYNLGGYSFELKVQTVHEPGEEEVVSVFAICRSPDGTRETVPKDFPPGTTVESWTVEANETEATVYATVKIGGSVLPINKPLNVGVVNNGDTETHGAVTGKFVTTGPIKVAFDDFGAIVASASSGQTIREYVIDGGSGNLLPTKSLSESYTYKNLTVYYTSWRGYAPFSSFCDQSADFGNTAYTAWMMLYGQEPEPEAEDILIARFAIDLSEAGGGPDGDWDEPGSDGPFSDQIYVEVTGASAGTHSASNIPQEAPEQLIYGSGGIGGNGGGGGAGASTVIIYDFVSHKTSIDGPAENAIIRESGTGGPGGKGGKGGDGCILIFY